jgi:di/tricarboxylate transporter
MVHKTGLARRIAYSIISVVGTSYSRVLMGMIIVDFVMTLLVPSGLVRVVILASISLGLLEAFGVAPKSNIARGLFIILTYTATIFDKMVIAGVTSMLARGIIQDVGNVPVYYGQWFLAFLPCDLITIVVCWRVILWLYPPEVAELPGGRSHFREQLQALGPFSGAELRASIFVGIALGLWLTDFYHHIPSAMIALGVGLMACMPGIGVMSSEDVRKLNVLPIFLVASVLSMAVVLIDTQAVKAINDFFLSWLRPDLSSMSCPRRR